MPHTHHDRERLLKRVRRLAGQVEAVHRKLQEEEHDCLEVLQLVAACRGAMNGLMREIVEGHVREHVHVPGRPLTAEQERATEQLLELVRSYLR